MSALRGVARLAGFMALTLPLMPVQAVLLKTSTPAARRFPHWYHRQVCRVLGITLQIDGAVRPNAPVLLVSNHTSWLDIPVLSAVAPVSFVAKREVGSWPFVAWLAKLQRSVFIDRTRRQAAGAAADEIGRRLGQGDALVLFAEGTSSDGNRVLPFKTSLFGAVAGDMAGPVVVQTAAVVYTHCHGVPLTRAERPQVAWYGDMEMTAHAWAVLKGGPIRVTVRVSEPVPLSDYSDRKDLARATEKAVRRAVLGVLRARPDDASLEPADPPADARRAKLAPLPGASEKWT